MKMRGRRQDTWIVAGLTGLALGWFGGARWGGPLTSAQPPAAAGPASGGAGGSGLAGEASPKVLPPSVPEAEADLAGGLAVALAAPSTRRQMAALEVWLASVPAERCAEAIELVVERIPMEQGRPGYVNEILRRWAEQDPRAALTWAERGMPGGTDDDRSSGILAVLEVVALTDPAAVERYAAARATGWLRGAAYSVLASALTERDPEEAWALVGRLPREFAGDGVSLLFHGWSRRDPAAAAQRWSQVPPAWQLGAAVALAGGWAETDPEAALRWAAALPPGILRQAGLRETVGPWARLDPAAAAAFAWHEAGRGLRLELVPGVLRDWAARDPGAARAWIAGLPEGNDKRQTLRGLAGLVAEQDPEKALGWAALLPPGPEQILARREIGARWMRTDEAAALQWARGLTDPEDQDAVWPLVVDVLGERDAPTAARIAQAMPPGEARAEALYHAARHLAGADLRAATAWLESLPNHEDAAGAWESVVVRRLEQEPQAVATWAAAQAPSPYRDSAYASAAVGRSWDDPASALALALAIRSDERRLDVLAEIVSNWRDNDPEAAAAWIARAPVAEDVRAYLVTGPRG